MNWKVDYLEDTKVVLLTVTGTVDADELLLVNRAHLEAGQKYSCTKYIVDTTEVLMDFKRFDVFELPNSLYSNYDLSPDSKFAMIKPKDAYAESIVGFFVMATQKLGWAAKVCPNLKNALAWLQES
jgi:hypothetical protein